MMSPAAASHLPIDVRNCRVCGGSRLVEFLDLGTMPLANAIRRPEDESPEPRFPLAVALCEDCALSQLTVVVPADQLFRHYVYRSGVSETFLRHCRTLAAEASSRAALGPDDLVMDIGSNDGTLLSAFLERGLPVLGVDPAANLAGYARAKGVETFTTFWNRDAGDEVLRRWGHPRLITATNVAAHVHDLSDFLGAIASTLDQSGTFMVEVPYMADLIEKNEFDTVYHEHLSYFLLKPLLVAAEHQGLHPHFCRRIPVHGGGLRVYFRKERPSAIPDTVLATLAFEDEAGLYGIRPYRRFSREIESIRTELREAFNRLHAERKSVAAYGASAKGATLLNSVGATIEDVRYIVDDTPEKQGHLAPGTRIPIVPAAKLREAPPDYLLILAWNFVDEILAKTTDYSRNGGRYIVPVPALRYLA